MSVYTAVQRPQLESFLATYAVGDLLEFEGIEAGIENTNYFVTTSVGNYVLTLFESTPPSDLEYFLALMAYFAEHGVASAHPLPNREARYLTRLNGKPAALVARLAGASVSAPQCVHCRALGRALAAMHLAGADFPLRRANDRGHDWRARLARELKPRLEVRDRALIAEVGRMPDLEFARQLPGGVIHADLFRDNALFVGTRLTGLIDFYYAHDGPFVYDLAVAITDWCWIPAATFEISRARAMLDAYQTVRPLAAAERAAWPAAVAAAAARFWLSRLKDSIFPRAGKLTHAKDPEPFREIYEFARAHPARLNAVWEHRVGG